MKFKVIDGYVLLDGEYKWKGEIIELPNDERREIWLEKRAIEPVAGVEKSARKVRVKPEPEEEE